MTMEHSALGEMLKQRRADGMERDYRHDADRQLSYAGDPMAGFKYTYDNNLLLKERTLRNNAAKIVYTAFDPRNDPTAANIPGGTITMGFDRQRRMTNETATFQSTTRQESFAYDALGRVRTAGYRSASGPLNSASSTYDNAGPLLSARFQEEGADFTVGYSYYPDGNRQSVTYPSGLVVTEDRDLSGRLLAISATNGEIARVTQWKGQQQPAVIQLGGVMEVVNQFDARGRLSASRVRRLNDGAVLAHLRVAHNGNDNVAARQFLHRAGKTDVFDYDNGERLDNAQIGAFPTNASSFGSALYQRRYNYDPGGLDYLTNATTSGIAPSNAPLFASQWQSPNAFLQPTLVDGFTRDSDPMGNTAAAQLQTRAPGDFGPATVAATLQHDGMGRLVRITRADGTTIENEFQPGGLRIARKVTHGAQVLSFTSFVYDNASRLLEEYDRTGVTPLLAARYYYLGEDSPVAADIRDGSGQLRRYFYLRDDIQSVMAVADAAGRVVERAWNDAFGQPVIESADSAPPVIANVIGGQNGALLIVMSEPVFAFLPDPGPATGIVPTPPAPNDVVTVSFNSTNLPGTAELLAAFSNFPPYSVVRFTPSGPFPNPPPTALISWWPADANVQDVSGGHNGFLRGGATNGPGVVQQGFVLNGSSAFVEVPNDPALNFGTNDFTVALWVNFSSTNGEQVLAEKWIESTKSGWSFVKLAGNRLRLALGDGAGNEFDLDSAALSLPPDTWIHFAIRRQGGVVSILTNGVPVASSTSLANLDSSASLKFGSREGSSRFLNGRMDEITFYSRALSDAELRSVSGGSAIPGPVSVTLTAGKVADDWGNTNAAEMISFNVSGQAGTIYYAAQPQPKTAAARLARSGIGSPFLFQGQYFDYDSGLFYLRARFYDPFAGIFLEPDPSGYEDSVNLYAAFGQNPASHRDPTGRGIIQFGGEEFVLMAREVQAAERAAGRELGPTFRAARVVEQNPAIALRADVARFFGPGVKRHWGSIATTFERERPGFLASGGKAFEGFTQEARSAEDLVEHLQSSGFRKFSDQKLADEKEIMEYFTHADIGKVDPATGRGLQPRFFGSPFGQERAEQLARGLTKTSNKGGSEIWLRFKLTEEGLTTEAVRVDRFGHLSNFNDAHYEGLRVGWGEVPHFHKETVPFGKIPTYLTSYVPDLPVYGAMNQLVTAKRFSQEWLRETHLWFESFPQLAPGQKIFWQASW
jgi:RHS repeat-associated protein